MKEGEESRGLATFTEKPGSEHQLRSSCGKTLTVWTILCRDVYLPSGSGHQQIVSYLYYTHILLDGESDIVRAKEYSYIFSFLVVPRCRKMTFVIAPWMQLRFRGLQGPTNG